MTKKGVCRSWLPHALPRPTFVGRVAVRTKRNAIVIVVVVFPCVGVCGYPVRTECGHACGGQDLQTFLPEVREFIKDTRPKTNTTRGGVGGRRTALLLRLGLYTHRPPGPLAAVGLLGGARRRLPGWGWLIPRVPYPCLFPQGIQTAILAARPRKGDVRLDVIEPRCG